MIDLIGVARACRQEQSHEERRAGRICGCGRERLGFCGRTERCGGESADEGWGDGIIRGERGCCRRGRGRRHSSRYDRCSHRRGRGIYPVGEEGVVNW